MAVLFAILFAAGIIVFAVGISRNQHQTNIHTTPQKQSQTYVQSERDRRRTAPHSANCLVATVDETESALSNLREFVVLDFETTGLSPARDRIIEVGLLHVRSGMVVRKRHQLVNPEMLIPQRIVELTGICNSDVIGQPTIDQVIRDVHTFIGSNVIVAHNAPFDVNFLAEAYRSARISATIKYVDTLKLSRALFPGRYSYKLADLTRDFDLGAGDNHNALDDAEHTANLFLCCQEVASGAAVTHSAPQPAPMPKQQMPKSHLTEKEWQTVIEKWGTEKLSDVCSSKVFLLPVSGVTYLSICCPMEILRFKIGARLQYALIQEQFIHLMDETQLQPATKSEGLTKRRYPLTSVESLDALVPVLLASYHERTT